MVFGEEAAFSVLEVENADNFVFVDQGHSEFRSRLRVRLDVSRILLHIAYQDRLLMLGSVADESHAYRNVVLEMNVFLETQGEAVLQDRLGRIEQEHAKHLVVDQATEQFAHALQEFV